LASSFGVASIDWSHCATMHSVGTDLGGMPPISHRVPASQGQEVLIAIYP
jgi:hypothetical protein